MSDRTPSRRTFLKTTGVVAAAGLGSAVPASAAETPSAPVPDDTDALTYATMGTDKDNPTATLYGNFKCPYTQEFVRGGNLEAVLNEYVTSGDLNLRFRALAYQPPGTSSHGSDYYYISDSDPLISQAALGVWDVSPEDYWGFFNYMFSDIISGNVSYGEMEDEMQAAGVDNRSTIIDRADSGRYSDDVEQNRYSAGDYGVTFTPTLVLDGETTAPHHGTEDLLDWIGGRISTSSSNSSDTESSSEDTSSDETSTSEDTSSDADSSSADSSSDSDSSSTDSSSETDDSSSDSSSTDTASASDQSSGSSASADTQSTSDSSSGSEDGSTDSSSDETASSTEQSSTDSTSTASDSSSESISVGDFCRKVLNLPVDDS